MLKLKYVCLFFKKKKKKKKKVFFSRSRKQNFKKMNGLPTLDLASFQQHLADVAQHKIILLNELRFLRGSNYEEPEEEPSPNLLQASSEEPTPPTGTGENLFSEI
jgi:hypothetical protein